MSPQFTAALVSVIHGTLLLVITKSRFHFQDQGREATDDSSGCSRILHPSHARSPTACRDQRLRSGELQSALSPPERGVHLRL